jgi:hypothetical protein
MLTVGFSVNPTAGSWLCFSRNIRVKSYVCAGTYSLDGVSAWFDTLCVSSKVR